MQKPILLIAALMSLGFIVDTPEARREQERDSKEWRTSVLGAYDLKALHAFLEKEIRARPIVEGVDLRKSRRTESWLFPESEMVGFLSRGLRTGDWHFSPDTDGMKPSVKLPDFRLSWTYETEKRTDGSMVTKTVTLTCQREDKSRFVLVRALRHEDEVIVLLP